MKNIKIEDKIAQDCIQYITVPGSKSITIRKMALASLANGCTTIHNPGYCEDTINMSKSLNALGVENQLTVDKVILKPGGEANGDLPILDVGLSATSTRILLSLMAVMSEQAYIDGHESMRKRPNKNLTDALQKLGVKYDFEGEEGLLPLLQKNKIDRKKSSVKLVVDVSSQYLTSLMIIAPTLDMGLDIKLVGDLVSKPYINITKDEMINHGIPASNILVKDGLVSISKSSYNPGNYFVEGDASALSYFAALAVLHNEHYVITNIKSSTKQGDIKFLDICKDFGLNYYYDERGLHLNCKNKIKLSEYSVDMEDMPDVAMTLMAMSTFVCDKLTITGLGTLRHKECDRIAVPCEHYRKLGVRVEYGIDFVVFYSDESALINIDHIITTHNDHRIAMSFTVFASMYSGIVIKDSDCVNKTYIDFWNDCKKIGIASNDY